MVTSSYIHFPKNNIVFSLWRMIHSPVGYQADYDLATVYNTAIYMGVYVSLLYYSFDSSGDISRNNIARSCCSCIFMFWRLSILNFMVIIIYTPSNSLQDFLILPLHLHQHVFCFVLFLLITCILTREKWELDVAFICSFLRMRHIEVFFHVFIGHIR